MKNEKESNGLIGIILAAGLGTRMKSSFPKVLHQVCGKSLIRRICDMILSLPLERRIVVISPQSEMIRHELPKGFEIAIQEKPMGTAHAVMSAIPLLKDWQGDVLILCSDTPLLSIETLNNFIAKHREGHYYGSVLTGKHSNPAGYGRVVRKGGDEVVKIVEDSHATVYEIAIEEINSGTYCFDWPSLKDSLGEIRPNSEKNEIYLTDVVENFASKKKSMGAYCVEDIREIVGINSRRQLAEAEKILRLRIAEQWMEKGVTIIDPASTFIDETVQIGEDTIIHPFTVIEGVVNIGKGCVIGPFAHLRDRTILGDRSEIGNFVEVKASRVGKHVKAKHLTYLGDTTIGENVNIGAGTITANYDGKKKHETIIEDGAFIGSGTILIAPVRVGKGAVTGAGAVVPRGKNVPDGSIVVGVPAKALEKNKISKIKNNKE